MARADSQRAIGAVTRLLRDHLNRRGFVVTIGRPEDAADTAGPAKLNLFLYETAFDADMRNVSLDEGRPPPVWLSLRYILTAFDDAENSDTPDAQELLGQGIMALHDLNFLRLDAAVDPDVRLALEMNPEPLKLTFEDSSSEVLSRLMQGGDDAYRLSTAVQVRPVLLMPAEPEPSSQLVGIDYTRSPAAEIGVEGISIEAIPSLGPRLDRVTPRVVEPGDTVTVHGADLHLDGLEAVLADQSLRLIAQRSDRVTIEVDGTPMTGTTGPIAAGTSLSAGEHGLQVRQRLGNGRLRGSNLLSLSLRPVVSGATLAGGDLQLTGFLLGGEDDDVVLTLLEDGKPAGGFETVVTSVDQQSLTVVGVGGAPAGTYLAFLRVNGVQARIAPLIVVGP